MKKPKLSAEEQAQAFTDRFSETIQTALDIRKRLEQPNPERDRMLEIADYIFTKANRT